MIEYGRNPKQTFSAATPRHIDILVLAICLIAFTLALFFRSGRLSSRSQQQQRKTGHTAVTWWPSLLRFRLGQSQASISVRGGANDDEKIRDSSADAGIDSDANSKNGLRAGGFEKFGGTSFVLIFFFRFSYVSFALLGCYVSSRCSFVST